MTQTPVKCKYCRQRRPANSDYEQENIISGEWSRLCWPCAKKRLNNPFTGLLAGFRRLPFRAALP
jgi:hypothetical protein